MTLPSTTLVSTEMQHCIDNCLSCYATCVATHSYCLEQQNLQIDRTGMVLLLDCSEICRTSAGFLLRGSELHRETCRVCAAVCTRCADWCDRLQRDAVMKQCSRMCRECAAACEAMAAT